MLLHAYTAWRWISRTGASLSCPSGFSYCWSWLKCPLAAAVTGIITTDCFCGERIQRKLRAGLSATLAPYRALFILCSLLCLSPTLFTCGKASHHITLPILHCCPYHFTTWRYLFEPMSKIVDTFSSKPLHATSNLQLLSSRLYMWSETEPGAEQLKCIGACLNMLA